LPSKINGAINPWLSDNLNDLLYNDPHHEEQQQQEQKQEQHQEKQQPHDKTNTSLLSSLLVEIVNILEKLCKPLLNAETDSLQMESNSTPAPLITQNSHKPKPEWQIPKKTFRKREYVKDKIELSNRYKPFENTNEHNKKQSLKTKYNNVPCTNESTNSNNNARKKPNICETAKYVENMNADLPIRPGNKSYARTASGTSTIAVVTDSMCRSIRNNDINHFIDNDVEEIKIYKFPGAHAQQIQHYSKWTIENDEPDSLVVICGTNDINYSKDPSVEQISKKVLDVARQAKHMGIQNIFICGITGRNNNRYVSIIKDTNLFLRLVSSDKGFVYIDNENILKSDLNRDGLHLNPSGTDKLMKNILQHTCKTYLC